MSSLCKKENQTFNTNLLFLRKITLIFENANNKLLIKKKYDEKNYTIPFCFCIGI